MKKAILIVDDETEIRNAIEICLRKADPDYQIFQASNGLEGLKVLRDNKNIKVMILDLIMPELNGEKVLFELNEHWSNNLKIIVLSAYSEILKAEDALNYKVFQFLAKPVSLEPLTFAVASAFTAIRSAHLKEVLESIDSIDEPLLKQNLSVDDVYDRILSEALKWTDTSDGSILTYNENHDDLRIRAFRPLGKKAKEYIGHQVPIDDSICGKAFRKKQSQLVDNTDEYRQIYKIRNDMKSAIAVPLMINGDCLGILNIESPHPGNFVEADQKLLEILAAEAAILLQNANLKDELIKNESFSKLGKVAMHITHGIGSIIGLVNVKAQLLSEKLIKLKQEHLIDYVEDIDFIIEQSNKASEAKNRILRCYKEDIKIEKIDITEMLGNIVEERKLVSKNVEFHLDFPEQAISIRADPELIKLAFEEIINNACQAIVKQGSIFISATIFADYKIANIEITDTGAGIKKADEDNIFSPFFSRYENEGGTGVGLWSAREIFTRFRCEVYLIRTELNKGSTFRVKLQLC